MIRKLVGGCLRRLLLLALLITGAWFGWRHRAEIHELWVDVREQWREAPASPSPALADSAERKLRALASADGPGRVSLSEAEVQSLIDHRITLLLPAFVDSPRVQLRDGRLHLTARVPTARLPSVGELSDAVAFLPDTAEVGASGQFIPYDSTRMALEITRISAARVPLPRTVIPTVLKSLGRSDEARLPANALALPLPPGADAAYISGDSLVFLARIGREASR